MVFHTDHDCGMYCKRLVAYVRIEDKWTTIGHYGTECKEFEPLDLAKEEEERLIKQRVSQVLSRVKQSIRENKEATAEIHQDNEIANLFGIKLKSFCSDNDDVTS